MPPVSNRFDALLLWMDDEDLIKSREVFVKLGTKLIPGRVTKIEYLIDVNSGEHRPAEKLRKNEIALCGIELAQPIVLDAFDSHRTLGELILIDRVSNATSACGVVQTVFDPTRGAVTEVTPETRAQLLGQSPYVVVAESPEAAKDLERTLLLHGWHTMLLEDAQAVNEALLLLQQAGLVTVLPRSALDGEAWERLEKQLAPDTLLQFTEDGAAAKRLGLE